MIKPITFLIINAGNDKNKIASAKDTGAPWGALETLPRFYKIHVPDYEDTYIDDTVTYNVINEIELTEAEKQAINTTGEITVSKARFNEIIIDTFLV